VEKNKPLYKRFDWYPLWLSVFPLLFVLVILLVTALLIFVMNWSIKASLWIYLTIFFGILISVGYARIRHIRPGIWSMIANAATVTAYFWAFSVLHLSWWSTALLSLGLLAPLGWFANQTLKMDMQRATDRRQKRVDRIVWQVRSKSEDKPLRFGLYLRPFHTTSRLPAQVDGQASLEQQVPSHLDFETVLTRTLDKDLNLIALGKKDDIPDGVARVTLKEHDWREVLQQLMDRAALVIVVPLAWEGTLWEIRELKKRGHFEKTVFLMPEPYRQELNGVITFTQKAQPWDGGIRSYDPAKHFLDIVAEWEKARAVLKQDGLALPPYSGGALFTIAPETGRVNQIAPLTLSVMLQGQAYIRNVLTAFGRMPWRPVFNTDLLAAFENAAVPCIRNREFVLKQAFDVFAGLGDTETISAIAQRMNRVVRGKPKLLNAAIANLPKLLASVNQSELDLPKLELMQNWLDATQDIDGINPDYRNGAYKAVNAALKKRTR
jgi:hypothetical protein